MDKYCIGYVSVCFGQHISTQDIALQATIMRMVEDITRTLDLGSDIEHPEKSIRDLKVFVSEGKLEDFLMELQRNNIRLHFDCMTASQCALCVDRGHSAEVNLPD